MILDFYILRRFALWLAISVVALWVIAAIVDLIESIDTFIDHAAQPGQILRYYLFRSPYWIVLTLPAAGMLATLFSLTGFAHRGEIAAMKAAGVSLNRILVPVLACALLFSVGGMLFTEYVVPPATFRYNTTRDDIRSYSRSDGSRRQVLLQDVGGQLVFARSYDHTRQRAQQVLWERRPGDRTVERATAKRMEWNGKGWTAVAGTRYALAGDRFEVSSFDTLTLSSLTLEPGDFSRQQKKPEEMNFGELRSYVDRARANGEDATRHPRRPAPENRLSHRLLRNRPGHGAAGGQHPALRARGQLRARGPDLFPALHLRKGGTGPRLERDCLPLAGCLDGQSPLRTHGPDSVEEGTLVNRKAVRDAALLRSRRGCSGRFHRWGNRAVAAGRL